MQAVDAKPNNTGSGQAFATPPAHSVVESSKQWNEVLSCAKDRNMIAALLATQGPPPADILKHVRSLPKVTRTRKAKSA